MRKVKEGACIKEVPFGTKIEPATFVFARDFMMMEHNYLCAACRSSMAVIDTNRGLLQPCWDCQKKGYQLVKLSELGKVLHRKGVGFN